MIMEFFSEVFFSFTFGGEALSLAASIQTISDYHSLGVQEAIDSNGGELLEGLRELITRHGLEKILEVQGYPGHGFLSVADYAGNDSLLIKTFIQQEFFSRNILWQGGFNVSFSHSKEYIDYTLAAADSVFTAYARINDQPVKGYLRGQTVIEPTFRQHVFKKKE